MRSLLVLVFLVFNSSVVFAAWDLNDVSYLMPLPTSIYSDHMLHLESTGARGVLLPAKFLSSIPPLTVINTQDETAKALRVIAVRIDPCFPLPTPQSCQRQIRLIWQPLEVGPRNRVQVTDASLHSFYLLNETDFKNLMNDLSAWKSKFKIQTQGLPLQIHPAWSRDGDNSVALAEFNGIVLKYAGLQNLMRVTAMVLRGTGDMWAFQGFTVNQGKLELMRIPRIDRFAQVFVNQAMPSDHFENGQINPAPAGDDTLNNVITDSGKFNSGFEDLLRKELRAMYRIEDPKSFNPENTDCVSCHVSQPARQWIMANRTDLGIDNIWLNFSYKNARYNLSNQSANLGNTQIIRAFGYFNSDVAISQRVINESAEVADSLNLMQQ